MTRSITPTYVLLNQITLAAAAGSVTFSNVPQEYGDLVLTANWANSSTGSAGRLQLNADTGSNYNGVWMTGFPSTSTASAAESSQTSARIAGASFGPVSTYSNTVTLQFLDYSSADKHKTIISRYGASAGEVQSTVSRWASTNPITSIRFFDILGQTFQSGATFSLYGIAA